MPTRRSPHCATKQTRRPSAAQSGLGAALGGTIGGGRGAGLGAASGAIVGTGVGAANAQNTAGYLQQQYNAYYAQCMASRRYPPPAYGSPAPTYSPAPGHLETIWEKPDEGIWEVRGGRRQFTRSKVMAWVAFDRAIPSVEEFGLDGPVERWRVQRERVHEQVCREGFDPKLNSFVQSYGAPNLDASVLLLPLVGFLPAEGPAH
jgi:hypothetical protein